MNKFNKGEWTELYVVCKLASNNSISIADSHLRPVAGKFIKVVKIFMEDRDGRDAVYDVSSPGQIRSDNIGGYGVNIVDMSDDRVERLLGSIINGSGSSFVISDGELIMEELSINGFKSSSFNKADLRTETFLPYINDVKRIDYSVKSQLGGLPTLLNASKATNFIYRISGINDGDIDRINSINTRQKVYDRIQMIKQSSGHLSYYGMCSETFKKNLRKVDTLMPEIMAELILAKYSQVGVSHVDNLCKIIASNSALSLSEEEIVEKVKKLLVGVSLGLLPTIDWNEYGANGFIVVRTDGELLGYTLYEMSDLKEYLYYNTKLETASTGRHEFGNVFYGENGKFYMKLNLDIRFT